MMSPTDKMTAWTAAYSVAAAISLWRDNIEPEETAKRAAKYADAFMAGLEEKERQLMPRGKP